MRAVYHQQYRKRGTGALMFVYIITGTNKEINDYIEVQEAATGRAAGTWPKADNGAPLWWLNATREQQNGNNPKLFYTLGFNRDKTSIVRDESAAQMAAFAKRDELKQAAIAQLQAEIELGLRIVPTRAGNMSVTTSVAGTKLEGLDEGGAGKENKSLADEIVNSIGAGADGAEGEDLGE